MAKAVKMKGRRSLYFILPESFLGRARPGSWQPTSFPGSHGVAFQDGQQKGLFSSVEENIYALISLVQFALLSSFLLVFLLSFYHFTPVNTGLVSLPANLRRLTSQDFASREAWFHRQTPLKSLQLYKAFSRLSNNKEYHLPKERNFIVQKHQ